MFRIEKLNFYGYKINSLIAKSTIKSKKIEEAKSLEELGRNWQKGFPAKKQVPVVAKDEKTIFGEIHTICPLRGTEDLEACYKMMSYDREIVKKAGGQFVVLESQAEKGVQKCRIAIRFQNEDMSDLKQAHER